MSDVDARFYISILLRRLPYLVAIVSSALALAVIVASILPPLYRASAKILVEAPQIPAELARSTVPIQATQQLQIIRQQITARDDLLALARKLEVYGTEKAELSDQDIVDDMRFRIAFEEIGLRSPYGDPGPSVASVSFTADDPDLAARVVNEFVDLILLKQQQQRTGRAADTVKFFDREVGRLGSDLNRLEAEILRYKNENADTLPESLEFRRSLQTSQQERLIALEREESDLRARRSNLVESYALTGQTVDGSVATPEQQMLLELNRALAEQLAIFSENSQNIVALRARIASLQAALRSRPATESPSSASDRGERSGLDLQLSFIDERLRVIGREKAAITQRIAELTKSIGATPNSETVLYSLERNRTNLQTQYNTAIARRAEAMIGEQIERRADGGRFSVLERATPPQYPESPKRRRIVLLGAMGGLGLAVALIGLLEFFNGTIRRPVELVRMLDHQPLATIPYISTADEIRIRIRRTVAAVFSAAAAPVALVAAHYFYMPLPLVFQNVYQWLTALV
ncbi:lipopolysaccharide biosynthesis protein [Sinorhizobium garamanticum]|uniref:Lipopolysaccharide biosynthesis protein n=1 Tax=Sinorhizobium garamanticum TaxID=680247 RepID=A0ABY8DK05_9HYPH|nr:lipopolysaccharide biosynthesis protein [Sinorhizobium garamanticum]WEX91239.1 lipopolysaccharide biosynthesis protein [Sinorhizobium garamanticum]